MSAYDRDPRVRVLDEYFVIVTGDDEYRVIDDTCTDRWFTVPSLNNRAFGRAGLRSREEADEWLRQRQVGPFPSRDAAIASLIGPPR